MSAEEFTKLRGLVAKDHNGGWDEAWRTDIIPWDAGSTQPALKWLVESKAVPLPTSGNALIPGCGRGYDASYLASALGLNVLAVDISDTAVVAANEFVKANTPSNVSDKVKIVVDDFFEGSLGDGQGFDLVYDYTFFVAIRPEHRPKWGQRMDDLVKKGGYLVTLVFPIDPPVETGPPFFVRPEHYVEVLQPQSQWEKVFDQIPEKSAEHHVGRERMIVWKRL
ncbi:hypothetical protein EIP91_011090 [Steccherinum ochraceum]|uniref:Thiol methyltransferase 1 n=1 Tax=Steccherinum ochraceum TaxID=92696 RepID=A0A4R0RYI3_9APHY|nr:hypothetical protein EIP91_011090 [Steccherinum ochraceum]